MLWAEPFVICGFGRVGEAIAKSAVKAGRLPHQVTIVERDEKRARRAKECGYRVVGEDATRAPALRSAGVGVASRIVVCLGPGQAVATVWAARSLAPGAAIHVVLDHDDGGAAIEAGATGMLSLADLAGKLLARAALQLAEEERASQAG